MKKRILCFAIATILISATSYAQLGTPIEQITFSSRIDNPVEVLVEQRDNKIHFFAKNRSFYTFTVELNFSYIQNLTPCVTRQKEIVKSGNHRILTLEIKNREQGFDYAYKCTYSIGDESKSCDLAYPYLMPLRSGKKVNLHYPQRDSSYFLLDHFKTAPGDTIFCMRKGTVTAIPDMYHESDRLSKNKSLEIRHSDGSVMIYENLDPNSVSLNGGETVYPGQPIGTCNDKGVVYVCLYEFLGGGSFIGRKPLYVYRPEVVKPFDFSIKNHVVCHPREFVEKEMSSREIKRRGKK